MRCYVTTKFKKGDRVWVFNFDCEDGYVFSEMVISMVVITNNETSYSLCDPGSMYTKTWRLAGYVFATKEVAKNAAKKEAANNYNKYLKQIERA